MSDLNVGIAFFPQKQAKMNKEVRNTFKRKWFYSHSKTINIMIITINIRTVK